MKKFKNLKKKPKKNRMRLLRNEIVIAHKSFAPNWTRNIRPSPCHLIDYFPGHSAGVDFLASSVFRYYFTYNYRSSPAVRRKQPIRNPDKCSGGKSTARYDINICVCMQLNLYPYATIIDRRTNNHSERSSLKRVLINSKSYSCMTAK